MPDRTAEAGLWPAWPGRERVAATRGLSFGAGCSLDGVRVGRLGELSPDHLAGVLAGRVVVAPAGVFPDEQQAAARLVHGVGTAGHRRRGACVPGEDDQNAGA